MIVNANKNDEEPLHKLKRSINVINSKNWPPNGP